MSVEPPPSKSAKAMHKDADAIIRARNLSRGGKLDSLSRHATEKFNAIGGRFDQQGQRIEAMERELCEVKQ